MRRAIFGSVAIVACLTEIDDVGPRARLDAYNPLTHPRIWTVGTRLPRKIRCMVPGPNGTAGSLSIFCGSTDEGVAIVDAVNRSIPQRLAQGTPVHALSIGDVTNDGVADLVIAVWGPEASIFVFSGPSFLSEVWRTPLS